MRTKKSSRATVHPLLAWAILVSVVLAGVGLDVAVQVGDLRRDRYLANHNCRVVNYAARDQIYECDTGLMRLRDL